MKNHFKVNILSLVLLILIASITSLWAGNPGKSAMNCIKTSQSGSKFTFKNTCNYNIFVVWCGDLKYSKKRCGDGKGGRYYTHSNNIKPFDNRSADIEGKINFAACKGQIGFGRKGFIDYPNGSYKCTKTGS